MLGQLEKDGFGAVESEKAASGLGSPPRDWPTWHRLIPFIRIDF